MPELTGKLADPEFRHARAVKAASARTTLDHHVAQIVARAPDLTPDQLDRLRALLAPGREVPDEDA